MAFDLSNYEPVAVRLTRWLEDCKTREVQSRVVTHLHDFDDSSCIFRAELFEGEVMIATGWARETQSQRGVNATSHFENAETSSVGRALANSGHAGSDPARRASREEMTRVARAQPAPPREQVPGDNSPVVSPSVVEKFIERLNSLPDEVRTVAKQTWVEKLGKPDNLRESQVDTAEMLVSSYEHAGDE